MAPIKYEEDMKERLEKRTIQPTSKSWDTLSQRLDNEEKKDSKKGFWRLGIAASFIGVLLVSNFFFNSEISANNNTIIVNDNTAKDSLKVEVAKQIIITPKQEVVVKTEEKPTVINPNKTKIITVKNITKTSNYANNKEQVAQIQETQIIDKTIYEKNEIIVSAENTDTKTEVIASSVSDKEINSLLENATINLAKQKTETKTVAIDHNGLLLEVEDELDESFRDKMLKVIKKGYKTVKESVAERSEE